MKNAVRSRLVTGVLVLIVVGLGSVIGGDVTVKEGDLDVDGDLNVDGGATVDDNLTVNGYLFAEYYATVDKNLTVGENLNVNEDADIAGDLDVHDVYASRDVRASRDVVADDFVWADYVVCYIGGFFTKVTSSEGYDPPYVLYDTQTRKEIIDRIKREVHPDKQDGAALFFNADTKRLETYIASEGKFYDLQGNMTYTMPIIEVPTTIYEAIYYLDRKTGVVESLQIPVEDKYKVKKGFKFDRKTGKFIDKASEEIVPKETAIELVKGL